MLSDVFGVRRSLGDDRAAASTSKSHTSTPAPCCRNWAGETTYYARHSTERLERDGRDSQLLLDTSKHLKIIRKTPCSTVVRLQAHARATLVSVGPSVCFVPQFVAVTKKPWSMRDRRFTTGRNSRKPELGQARRRGAGRHAYHLLRQERAAMGADGPA